MINNIKFRKLHYYSSLSSWWNGPLINVVDPLEYTVHTSANTTVVYSEDSLVGTEIPELRKTDRIDETELHDGLVSKIFKFFFEI